MIMTSERFEIHLAKDEGRFLPLANEVRAVTGGHWTEILDGLDQSYWDLEVNEVVITVHREHFLGVSVSGPGSAEGLAIARQIRDHFGIVVS